MKKIVFGLFVFGAFLALNGACYVKPAYPGSGPAAKAYCWDVFEIASAKYPSGENVSNKSTASYDHGGSYVYTKIDVFGYGDYTKADVSYDNMTLVQSTPIVNNYKIVVGKRYLYQKNSNTKESGLIRATNYGTVMDSVYYR